MYYKTHVILNDDLEGLLCLFCFIKTHAICKLPSIMREESKENEAMKNKNDVSFLGYKEKTTKE